MDPSAMVTAMRTHTCGELRLTHAGDQVALCGWVAHRRDHGGVTFIDLRDREGVVQTVFHPDDAPVAHAAAQELRGEWVVRIMGVVRERPEGMANADLVTGAVEVAVTSVEVLNSAETPPFVIEDRTEADELLRLEYRYLDLRRPEMTRGLRLRHEINRTIREHMDPLGFLEVETPVLTTATPEGARDFLVPSRIFPGSFYALPQSPQQLKQLLMVAGQDRYYQIVRCLRDEKPRADRGLEFTQLDVEMSFAEEEDVMAVIEPLYARIVRETQGADVRTPFRRMSYDEMLERYGSDKPDLRYGMELSTFTDLFEGSGFTSFAKVAADGGVIKGLVAPGGAAALSRKELDKLVEDAKGRGAAGLVWIAVEDEGALRSPVEKFLSDEERTGILERTGAGAGDLVCLAVEQIIIQIRSVNVGVGVVYVDEAGRVVVAKADTWCYPAIVPTESGDSVERVITKRLRFAIAIGELVEVASRVVAKLLRFRSHAGSWARIRHSLFAPHRIIIIGILVVGIAQSRVLHGVK